MRNIKLTFSDPIYLDELILDNEFTNEVAYLNPIRIDKDKIVLTDPDQQHSYYATEVFILSIFEKHLQRIIFRDSKEPIRYLNPIDGQFKGGLAHNTTVIISSVDIQITT